MSNIAEGFDRATRTKFHQFLVIAKSSCAEARSQLHVAYDVGYINKPEFDQLLIKAEEVGRIVNGLRMAVQKQRDSVK
jgi:four helix bundle protein